MLGRNHPVLRRLRVLRRNRGARDHEGVLVAEGLHLAEEALTSGAVIELAVTSPRIDRVAGGADLVRRLEERGIRIERTLDPVLGSVQDARSAQPLVLVVRRAEASWDRIWRERQGPPLVLVACGVQDPGNLGSMLRSADAAGATAFLALDGADLFHPRTVRATMGSLFRIPARAVDDDSLFVELRRHQVVTVGTAASGEVDYDRFDLRRPVALFLGAEGAGLPPRRLAQMAATVRIPMHLGVESLSVSAAAAVVLFEAASQRRSGRPA
jgi:TrmH family RNA methyltransferase